MGCNVFFDSAHLAAARDSRKGSNVLVLVMLPEFFYQTNNKTARGGLSVEHHIVLLYASPLSPKTGL